MPGEYQSNGSNSANIQNVYQIGIDNLMLKETVKKKKKTKT